MKRLFYILFIFGLVLVYWSISAPAKAITEEKNDFQGKVVLYTPESFELIAEGKKDVVMRFFIPKKFHYLKLKKNQKVKIKYEKITTEKREIYRILEIQVEK